MKAIFFLICTTLAYNALNAQLSVRNSNYIFASDRVIYVEDDVNLGEADSKIYLRDESQLIQGLGTTGNSGVGELSVYQDGNVGSYEYNYWCSPVGSTTNNFNNNPFGISLLNDITGLISSVPATFVHSTTYNGTASPLNIEPYWIWKFIASDEYAEWVHIQGTTGINAGEGFTMKGTAGTSVNNPGNNQNYEFKGKPNTGEISTSVLNAQFTLIGNPYPSAIDALAFIHDTDNSSIINGTIYYWEQDPNVNSHYLADYEGGYSTYTISSDGLIETFVPATFYTYNGDGTINTTTTGSALKSAERYIPIGQGFMVEGIGSGLVKIKNNHRAYVKESDDSHFYGANITTEKNFSNNSYDYRRFRINVDFNNVYTRQLVQTFHREATTGFDYGLESKSPDEIASNAYWLIEDEKYVAQALGYNKNVKIPLIVNLEENQPIRFRILDIQNFDSNQPIYLHDKETDNYINLRIQDYQLNLRMGNYIDRFEITFINNSSLGINEIEKESMVIKQDNSNSRLMIINPNYENIKSIQVFDVNGKLILNNFVENIQKEYSLSTSNFSSGTYLAYILFKDNKYLSKKVIINN